MAGRTRGRYRRHHDRKRQHPARFAGFYDKPFEATRDYVEDFAELGKYLGEPVVTYSAGMRARLNFALSIAVDFDCYLIDEVIAVGDTRFQGRSQEELFDKRADRSLLWASDVPDIPPGESFARARPASRPSGRRSTISIWRSISTRISQAPQPCARRQTALGTRRPNALGLVQFGSVRSVVYGRSARAPPERCQLSVTCRKNKEPCRDEGRHSQGAARVRAPGGGHPDSVKRMIGMGLEVVVESGAGDEASFADDAFCRRRSDDRRRGRPRWAMPISC